MYVTRTSRAVDAKGGINFTNSNMTPRRQTYYRGPDGSSSRGSRGKTIVDDDVRLGSSRGSPRGSTFLGGGGKARVVIDRNGHYGSDDTKSYAATSERRFRDDGLPRMVRSEDDAPEREGGVRFRDSSSRRADKLVRPEFAEDAKRASRRLDRASNYEDGIGSLRESDYPSHGKSAISTSTALPGIILECHKRTILEFASQRGTFLLPFDDRRLSEQIGPGTKIFMFDNNDREIHGVFQVESYADIDAESSTPFSDGAVVRVRVLKECIPLSERQFKEIIRENYYSNSKFTESLSKDQVMKLLQIFRPVDPVKNAHVSLSSSRRTLDSGVSQINEDFYPVSPEEIVYRKERWRRETVDARSSGGHSYRTQDSVRFPAKIPLQGVSSKSLEDYEDYVDEEATEDVPHSNPRLISGSNAYSVTRGKQQPVRGLLNSRMGGNHFVGSMGRFESQLAEADWREEDLDMRDLYRKRQLSLHNEMSRGTRSSSPPWKDARLRVASVTDDAYDSLPGQVGYKDEDITYMPKRGRRHNELDLNKPLELGYSESAIMLDVDSKAGRRRVWGDEELKRSSLSPVRGRSELSRSSLHLSSQLRDSDAIDGFDDSVLDSRHMVSASRKDYTPNIRAEENGRLVTGSYSNGKVGKPRQRTVVVTNRSNDKSVPSPIVRKRVVYTKEPTSRSIKGPLFQIKANFQTPGRGRAERVVTMVDNEDGRSWGTGSADGFIQGSNRKRKISVWSRISVPDGGHVQENLPSHGGGRVFSRLGPSPNSAFIPHASTYYNPHFERGDEPSGLRAKRVRREEFEAGADRAESSPDALEGEDYLRDDMGGSEDVGGEETDKTSGQLQGWNRKRPSTVKSSDNVQAPKRGELPNAKVGRRKLVRPLIGESEQVEKEWKVSSSAPTVATGGGDKIAEHPSRHSGSSGEDAPEVKKGSSPQYFQRDVSSPAENYCPEIEEDSMIS